jgi:transposase
MTKSWLRDPEKERYWRRLLSQWQRSGLSGRDFCAQESLSEASFYGWRREIAKRDREAKPVGRQRGRRITMSAKRALSSAFLPVQVIPNAEPSSSIEMVLPKGRLVRVGPGFDPATLRQVLGILENGSC